ncbi:MAG: hypothetical protein JW794_00415 [Candidatus Cloacimonetes bacterium]|nr:hypothetical protein [Candidatus Cloacimonadota bacterium]
MLKTKYLRLLELFTSLLIILTFIVSLYGILNIRIYKPFTPDNFFPGVLGQDVVSLVVSILLLIVLLKLRNSSEKIYLVWIALLSYLLYAYGIYAFDKVYNMFFLFYVAIFGISLYSLIIFFGSIEITYFQEIRTEHIPRRTIAVFIMLLGVIFIIAWMQIIIPSMIDKTQPEGNPIFVFDLSFFIPLLIISGIALFRNKKLGFLISGILLMKMGFLGFSVLLGALISPYFGLPLSIFDVFLYAILGIGSFIFAIIYINALRSDWDLELKD